MTVKLIEGKKLPRLATIPGLSAEEYRKLQAGETVEVNQEVADRLKPYVTESKGGNG